MNFRVMLFFCILIILSCNSYANEIFELENSVDTAYLPFKSVVDRENIILDDCSYPENNLIQIITPAIQGIQDGYLIRSDNPSPQSGSNSIFSPRTYPEFLLKDDDPIRYIITNWVGRNDLDSLGNMVIGVCHNRDSIFVFKLFEYSDSVEYSVIYVQPESANELVPHSTILDVIDFDSDAMLEIILYVNVRGQTRRVLCVDYKTLEINWKKEISSGLISFFIQPKTDTTKAKLLISTNNSANGMQDSIFNDRFSYLAILDETGEIIYHKLAGVYGFATPLLIKSEQPNEYFFFHYFNHDSIETKNDNNFYLSRISDKGEIIKSTIVNKTPIDLFLLRYGKNNDLRLIVRYRSKEWAVFDLELNLLQITKPLTSRYLYLGKIKIADKEDSVIVLNDGLYDLNFEKLLHFPFNAHKFQPAEYDSLGNVTAFLITENLHFYIGKIEKKTKIELASVFYHRNKIYVLILLSSLLVGLVTTNFFRRRSKTNLKIISKQKIELEKTHQSLKAAQATIVAQEKYRQAKDIAGGFAHEIRNNLFPAKSAISKLLSGSNDQLEDRDWIKKLGKFSDNSIDRAIKLTEHISNYTKLESQHQPEEVDLSKVISEVLEANKNRIENDKVKIYFENKKHHSVIGNNEQFYIVFNNLVLNALDALHEIENSRIDIISEENTDNIIISVRDNGCGIDPENINKIFEFFYSTKPSSGVGIGLALVKKIIDLYDCSIEVISNIDDGAEFKLCFNKTGRKNIN